jgi:hypothetical protein
MSALTLADITAKRIAAEDLHGRVFATACQVILPTPGGAALVKTLETTYRAMESLRHDEMQMISNGKIAEAQLNREL